MFSKENDLKKKLEKEKKAQYKMFFDSYNYKKNILSYKNTVKTTSYLTKTEILKIIEFENKITIALEKLNTLDPENKEIKNKLFFNICKLKKLNEIKNLYFTATNNNHDPSSGIISLKILKLIFDPLCIIKYLLVLLDNKEVLKIEILPESLEKEKEINIVTNHSKKIEFILLGEISTNIMGILILPCSFFVNKNKNSVFDFGSLNFIKFHVKHSSNIDGLDKTKTVSPVFFYKNHRFEAENKNRYKCAVCNKNSLFYNLMYNCSYCKIKLHFNCINFVFFSCSSFEKIEKIKNISYDIPHTQSNIVLSKVQRCSHCSEEIKKKENCKKCIKCDFFFHSSCVPLAYNSCQLDFELRKKLVLMENKQKEKSKNYKILPFQNIKIKGLLGKGSFSFVFYVIHKIKNKKLCLKLIKKDLIIEKILFSYIKDELYINNLIAGLKSRFFANIKYFSEDEKYFYLYFEMCKGGNLSKFIKNNEMEENEIKQWAAEIIMGINILHKNKIAHLDLKSKNILINRDGHLKICDFSISKHSVNKDTVINEKAGTFEIMAPEYFSKKGVKMNVDYWALGILIYEMFEKKRPFRAKTVDKIEKKILTKKIKIKSKITKEGKDLIKGLLHKDKEKRIGAENGIEEIKKHPWFKEINWEDVLYLRNKSFYKPRKVSYKNKEIKKIPNAISIPKEFDLFRGIGNL